MACEFIGWTSLNPDAQAAWVQAIGSLVAVGVAILVPVLLHLSAARRQAEQDRISAVIVAGAISPFVANALTRIGFFRKRLEINPDQFILAQHLPLDAFEISDTLRRFQDRFHLLGQTGVLANDHLADMALLSIAMRVIHRERLTPIAVARMIDHCDRAGPLAERLLKELDEISPSRRATIEPTSE